MNERIVDANDGRTDSFSLSEFVVSVVKLHPPPSPSAIRNGFLGGEFDTLCSDAVEEARESGR